jgi:hypothetical protein
MNYPKIGRLSALLSEAVINGRENLIAWLSSVLPVPIGAAFDN